MWQDTKRIFLDSAESLLRATARLLPSVLAMLLFFALSVVLAVAIRGLVRRVCERLALDRRLREWGVWPMGGASPTKLLTRVSFWAVLALGVFFGLSVLDSPTALAVSMRLLEYVPRVLVGVVIFAI